MASSGVGNNGAKSSRLYQDHRRRPRGFKSRRVRVRLCRRSSGRFSAAVQADAATETRNTCTYCSVACGILIYSLGDRAKNARSDIIHIEGDPDHPVNRGTLCPKGSALLDIVHAPTRLKVPKYRAPGADEFKEVSWDFALDRIAKLMKEDRDKNFIAKNEDGTTVNRWISTGMLAASASSNETAYITWKVARSLGMVVFDNQARV